MDTDIRQRISATPYLMIMGIVVLQTPPYKPLREMVWNSFDMVKGLFPHGLFKPTVPALAAISGMRHVAGGDR
jgi:hypothetical protein